jgi:hypothetical protein
MTIFRAKTGRFLIALALLLVGRCSLAVPSFSSGVQTGNIQNAAVNEASGIAASRLNANVLWVHDDSGNPAQVFPMTAAGTNLGTYNISGASNVDWEDIATGPGPAAGTQYLYIGDIGDNFAARANISVYRVPEPLVSDTQSPMTVSLTGAAKLTFAYPDGPRDAESMFVDPLTRDIYFISKRENPHHLYRAAYPQSTSGTTTLELMTTFNDPNWLTAADINPNGHEIIARAVGSNSGRLYLRPPGGSITDAFAAAPITIPLRAETQGEAIGFDRQGWGYYTTSEGAGAPIYYFNRLAPAGDFNHDGAVNTADYVVWRKGLGTIYTAEDFNVWKNNFGATAGGGASTDFEPSTAAPEPASWVLLSACAAILLARRLRPRQDCR